MKLKLAFVCLFASLVASNSAFANADDIKWIAQCLKDNKHEGASEDVVYKYCKCMNNKMDENETRSITQWEKANPKAAQACDKEAGWH